MAKAVRRVIEECGFECYMAVAVNSPRSLRENIFDELEATDYFVFIDFQRDRLPDGQHRGSLFVNQELAIALFLNIPLIGFQEKGVRELDGMMGALQVNATPFSDKENLHILIRDQIAQKLSSGEWTNASRNSLTILDPPPPVDAMNRQTGLTARYFQVPVKNNHAHKAALDCFVYLECVKDLATEERFTPETAEFKWAGITLPGVRIGPGTQRRFDAFHFPILDHNAIGPIGFNVYADSTQFYPWQMNTPGRYEPVYSVVSKNFPTARRSFLLELGDAIGTSRLSDGSA